MNAGGVYAFVKLRFPCCLVDHFRGSGLMCAALHAMGHVSVKTSRGTLGALVRWGLAYGEAEGATCRWQWRFWRGSPLQREMRTWE